MLPKGIRQIMGKTSPYLYTCITVIYGWLYSYRCVDTEHFREFALIFSKRDIIFPDLFWIFISVVDNCKLSTHELSGDNL